MITRIALIVFTGLLLSSCSTNSAGSSTGMVEIQMSARTGGPPAIRVLEPSDGASVASPFTVRVTTENVALAPAGRTLDGEAHWHVMVDGACLPAGEVIPKDDNHLHVGSGEDHAEFDLSPGEHDLCVQLGDGFHVAVAVSDVVRINVVEAN